MVAPSPMAEPTEMSIPPVAITSVRPSPTSATFVACVKMLENVSQGEKIVGEKAVEQKESEKRKCSCVFRQRGSEQVA